MTRVCILAFLMSFCFQYDVRVVQVDGGEGGGGVVCRGGVAFIFSKKLIDKNYRITITQPQRTELE